MLACQFLLIGNQILRNEMRADMTTARNKTSADMATARNKTRADMAQMKSDIDS